MEEMKFVTSNDLLVDRSPGCGGIWLDRAEFPKVEKIAASIGDVKSKIMMTCQYFKNNGYHVLGDAVQK